MLFYRLIRSAFRVVAGPMFRFRVEGGDAVPPAGAGIVVAPHRSWLDPACVGGACPRPVRFLIIDRIYRKPWARWFYDGMRSVPIKQGGAGSIAALRAALRLLAGGELVGIFPEGRVVKDGGFGRVHPGAALLAVRSQAPVIPAYIGGSDVAWPHGTRLPRPAPVYVRFGAPIVPPSRDAEGGVEALRELIESRLHALAAEGPP